MQSTLILTISTTRLYMIPSLLLSDGLKTTALKMD